jgi:antitoxin VapB
MALNIKNAKANKLAHELADETGETLTEAVTIALSERLASLRRKHGGREVVLASVRDIQAFVHSLPDRDDRGAEEILGYDEFGLPP